MNRALSFGLSLAILAMAAPASAHYCSNIWTAPARLVVKPEQSTVHITGTNTAQLKVYMQNNFPFQLFNAKMQGSATNYTVTVSPASQNIAPGQQVLFTYSIKHNTGFTGDIQVSTLKLAVNFRVGTYNESSSLVNQNPSQTTVVNSIGGQVLALNAATLADKYPSATYSQFNRTGIQQLIKWFGYRFCYNSGGAWRSGSQDCPTPTPEGTVWSNIDQFPQDCMRAGIELGVRKAKLGSQLDPARNGAVNAMKAGSVDHRCLAAVVGGLLWKGAADTTSFETALNSLSAACKAAGLRALGKGTAATCTSGTYVEKAACAAAEGLAGNDAPVKAVLMPNAGDGESSDPNWGVSLYYSYMLYLVTHDRYAQGKQPTYYPTVGGPTPDQGVVPKQDKGTTPKADGPVAKTDGSATQPDKGPPPLDDAGKPIPIEASVPAGDHGAPAGDGGAADEGGCGCATATRPASALPVFLLLLVGAGLRLRRRR